MFVSTVLVYMYIMGYVQLLIWDILTVIIGMYYVYTDQVLTGGGVS